MTTRAHAHHLACALATLLKDHQVHDVLLLAALNVPTSNTLCDGAVYQVAMNSAVPFKCHVQNSALAGLTAVVERVPPKTSP
ncbi:hypothetical protein DFJ73DRAFT_774438 [Zopfochytrium polystomum]|nr:hypothetical protein DFJ73DRAFT_774438 [Zopfochytrium polystomum]